MDVWSTCKEGGQKSLTVSHLLLLLLHHHLHLRRLLSVK
jgi:hypothetical protein